MKSIATDMRARKVRTEVISLDLIPDPFIILRSDNSILDANLSFCTLIGSDKAAVVNRNYHEIDLFRELSRKIAKSFLSGLEDVERIAFHIPARLQAFDHIQELYRTKIEDRFRFWVVARGRIISGQNEHVLKNLERADHRNDSYIKQHR